MDYFSQWPNLCVVDRRNNYYPFKNVFSSADYILFFFATNWMKDCHYFAPILSRFAKKHHKDKKFLVLYLSRDTTKEEFIDFFMFDELKDEIREKELTMTNETYDYDTITAEFNKNIEHNENNNHNVDNKENSIPYVNDHPVAEGYVEGASYVFQTNANALHGEYFPEDYIHNNNNLIPSQVYFYAIPWEHSEEIVSPLLYDFRIFSYPQVVVVRNHKLNNNNNNSLLPHEYANTNNVTAKEKKQWERYKKDRLAQNERIKSFLIRQYQLFRRNRRILQQYIASHTNNKEGIPMNKQLITQSNNTVQRQEGYVPYLLHRQYRPHECTIAGRFMMELRDVEGEQFPWDGLAPGGRALLVLVLCILVCLVVGAGVAVMLAQEKRRQRALEAWKL